MMRSLRLMLLAILLQAGAALAGTAAFDQGRFDALAAAGKPVLVVIHADWCPVCKVQEPVVSELLGTPELKAIEVLQVDFDRQQKVVKALKASMQSTLIVFKGGREMGRSVGDTARQNIAALLKKAL